MLDVFEFIESIFDEIDKSCAVLSAWILLMLEVFELMELVLEVMLVALLETPNILMLIKLS
jgi:hypothetical protein